jgi:hypothetical protein
MSQEHDNQSRSSQSLEKAMDGVRSNGQRLNQWWQSRPVSDAERSERSERFFWWRVVLILGVAITVATLGVLQVRRSSSGIRTAYELVRANDALREQMEANRHAEANLTGLKNPNELRKEANEVYHMRVPGADEQVEVE